MPETTITFRVDDDLKSSFAEAAKAQNRTAEQLLRDLMRQAVHGAEAAAEHEAWFRTEVEQALTEADDPAAPRLSHEDVLTEWHAQRDALLKVSRSQ